MFYSQAAPEAEIPKREPIPAYGYVAEPNTQSKLQEIRSSPEKARMVALLIRERVLGPKHPDTSYFIRYVCKLVVVLLFFVGHG